MLVEDVDGYSYQEHRANMFYMDLEDMMVPEMVNMILEKYLLILIIIMNGILEKIADFSDVWSGLRNLQRYQISS